MNTSRTTMYSRQSGLTLIELMISLVLGAVVLAGTVSLFQQSKSSSVQDEQVARMQENGRFALRVISRELGMMGYWAGLTDPGLITTTDASAGTDCLLAGWMLDLTPPIVISNYTPTVPATVSPYPDCITFATDIKPDSDVLSVKRVADQPDKTYDSTGTLVGTDAVKDKAIYLKTNLAVGAMFESTSDGDDGPTAVPNTDVSFSRYLPAVFYVRPYSTTAGDGIPTLVRETLIEDDMNAQALVEGVENLQIEFGIDGTDSDLGADYYTGAPTTAELSNAVTARIFLLVRSVNPITGYLNDKSYNLGSTTVAAANDAYYRRVYTITVQMRNADKLKLYALD